jgi:transposase
MRFGGLGMKRFVEGSERQQGTLFPEYFEDLIDENNQVRVVDAFVDALDLSELGFVGMTPAVTGRPGFHPSVLLKIYVYGYLNRIQSSRRLEREAQNVAIPERLEPPTLRLGNECSIQLSYGTTHVVF